MSYLLSTAAPRSGLPILSDEEAEASAALFAALADPARVRIVNLLATSDEPVCICNLIGPLGLSQPTVSHHMKKLLDAGLLEREQRGKWAYFTLIPVGARDARGARRLTEGGAADVHHSR